MSEEAAAWKKRPTASVIDAADYILDAMFRFMRKFAATPRELELMHAVKTAAEEVKRSAKQARRP